MSTPITIDIWSDIACPWCWLGKHRLETALAELAARPDAPQVAVSYHSYQLSPDLPEDYAGSHSDYLQAKTGMSAAQMAAAGQRLQALGQVHGLDYNFAASRIANTHKALELMHFARAHGKEAEVKELLFSAHFRDGVHIGKVAELAGIAAAAGLDPEAAAQALTAGTHAADVEADKQQAAQIGVTGVPFFVLDGKYGLSGAQEVQTFVQALTQVVAERATQ